MPYDLLLNAASIRCNAGFAAVKMPSSRVKAMPAADVSNSLRQRSSLAPVAASALRRLMNWPIWLPIADSVARCSSSRSRVARLKNSTTPRASVSRRIGKITPPRSPARDAAEARKNSGSVGASTIQLGDALPQT